VDHPLPILPRGGHRLLGHHVPAGLGHLHRLVRVDATRGREDHDIGVSPGEHGIQGLEARGPGPLDGPLQGLGVHVADPDQLRPVGVLVEGVEV
jgi:hypothetical protein